MHIICDEKRPFYKTPLFSSIPIFVRSITSYLLDQHFHLQEWARVREFWFGYFFSWEAGYSSTLDRQGRVVMRLWTGQVQPVYQIVSWRTNLKMRALKSSDWILWKTKFCSSGLFNHLPCWNQSIKSYADRNAFCFKDLFWCLWSIHDNFTKYTKYWSK